jgi:hypothetical protein
MANLRGRSVSTLAKIFFLEQHISSRCRMIGETDSEVGRIPTGLPTRIRLLADLGADSRAFQDTQATPGLVFRTRIPLRAAIFTGNQS